MLEWNDQPQPPGLVGRKRSRRLNVDGNLDSILEGDETIMDEEEEDTGDFIVDPRRAALEEAGLGNSDDEENDEDG